MSHTMKTPRPESERWHDVKRGESIFFDYTKRRFPGITLMTPRTNTLMALANEEDDKRFKEMIADELRANGFHDLASAEVSS